MYDFNAHVKPFSLRDLNSQAIDDQVRRQQLQEGQMRLSELGRQQSDQKALRDSYAKAASVGRTAQVNNGTMNLGGVDVSAGTSTVKGPGIDNGVLLSELGKVAPHMVPQLQDHIATTQAAAQKAAMEQQKLGAETGKLNAETQLAQLKVGTQHFENMAQELSTAVDQASYTAALQRLQARGTPGAAEMLQQHPQFDPTFVQEHVQRAIPIIEQAKNKQKDLELKIQQQNADTSAGRAKEDKRHNMATEAQAASGAEAAPELTPEGVDMTAKNFALTGNLPPLGMGKQGAKMRAQVINRAAEMFPSADLATNRAVYAANKSSLDAAQKQLDAVNAFEGTAKKNLDLFLEQAKNITDTGAPWLNQPIRSIQKNALGSKEQVAYEAARQVALTEIAKITNNPALNGVLSDSARHEILAFNPDNATVAQTFAVAKILKQDMANRKESLSDQVKAISQRIGSAQVGSGDHHVITIGDKKYQYKGSGATDDLNNYTEMK